MLRRKTKDKSNATYMSRWVVAINYFGARKPLVGSKTTFGSSSLELKASAKNNE